MVSRMLEYIRYDKKYCVFVNIFEKSLVDLIPFIISFIVFIQVFSLIIILMQGSLSINDPTDYNGIPFFIQSFI